MDDIIARRKLNNASRKRKRDVEEEDESLEDVNEDDEEAGSSDDEGSEQSEEESDDPLATSDEEDEQGNLEDGEQDVSDLEEDGGASSDGSSSEEETAAEKERKAAYFAPDDPSVSSKDVHSSFTTMSLSRPLLKAITALGFSTPTPIQAATIPVALLGKDVVGNAVTGSGKTAAFMIPVLERLMYRERGAKKAAVRCVVLVPTRELGVQCVDVAKKLAAFMDVRIALIVGKAISFRSRTYIDCILRRWPITQVSRSRTAYSPRHRHCNSGTSNRPLA